MIFGLLNSSTVISCNTRSDIWHHQLHFKTYRCLGTTSRESGFSLNIGMLLNFSGWLKSIPKFENHCFTQQSDRQFSYCLLQLSEIKSLAPERSEQMLALQVASVLIKVIIRFAYFFFIIFISSDFLLFLSVIGHCKIGKGFTI